MVVSVPFWSRVSDSARKPLSLMVFPVRLSGLRDGSESVLTSSPLYILNACQCGVDLERLCQRAYAIILDFALSEATGYKK